MKATEDIKKIGRKSQLNVLSMNKASMTVSINGETLLVSRRVFNKIINGQEYFTYMTMTREYQERSLYWLGLVEVNVF